MLFDLLKIAAAVTLGIAAASGGQRDADSAVTRVLFIGNSLTTTNNLPGLVERLAQSAGVRIACRAVAFPDYSLEDHWKHGEARRVIAAGGWSIVALQQGPSALPESRVLLREYTRRFDAEVRRIGARTALYMVWPSAARRGDFDDVSVSYATAARDVNGLLFPVGDAWRAAWRRDPSLALYDADGFHPSAMGSYLAALVIYQGVTGRSPVGLPAAGLAQPQALLLQQAAAEAVANLVPPGRRKPRKFSSLRTSIASIRPAMVSFDSDFSSVDTGGIVDVVERVAEVLGGHAVLRQTVRTWDDLDRVVRGGLPKRSLQYVARRVIEPGAPVNEFVFEIVPAATFKRRRGRLSANESERTERLARVIALADGLWESPAETRAFLNRPHPLLGGKAPLTVARTELGARRVERLLRDIEDGLPL